MTAHDCTCLTLPAEHVNNGWASKTATVADATSGKHKLISLYTLGTGRMEKCVDVHIVELRSQTTETDAMPL